MRVKSRIHILFLLVVLSACASLGNARSCGTQNALYGSADFQVDVTRYGDGAESKKSLLIIPPTGGTNLIDRSYAREFCAKGYDVYILNSWTEQNEQATDLELHQRFYGRARRALLITLDQTKSAFIGVLGTSVGALHASVAAATIERVNAVFGVVGGTPIAEVIVGSDQKAMQDLKAARKTRYGFTSDAQNIAAIGGAFQLEPMLQKALAKRKDYAMSMAENDTTVPFENQRKLRDFWQPEKVIVISGDHFWGIVKTWLFHSGELVKFFEASFEKSLRN